MKSFKQWVIAICVGLMMLPAEVVLGVGVRYGEGINPAVFESTFGVSAKDLVYYGQTVRNLWGTDTQYWPNLVTSGVSMYQPTASAQPTRMTNDRLSFDGTDYYEEQPVASGTATNFEFSNNQVRAINTSLDLTDPVYNDCKLVVSYSGVTQYGYIYSQANSGTTWSANLFDSGKGTFDSGTESWIKYGNNTIENDNGELKITYVDNAIGAYMYLSTLSADVTQNLDTSKLYHFQFDTRVNAGSSVNLGLYIGGVYAIIATITSTYMTTHHFFFRPTTSTNTVFNMASTMSAGEIIWLDNLQLYEHQGEALGGVKGVDGITKANPGVVTFDPGHSYSNGQLIQFTGLTEMTSLNNKYKTLANNAGDTFELGNLSSETAAETTGGNCAKQVTNLGASGVTISYTPVSGTTSTQYFVWRKSGTFNPNAGANYTWKIYKPETSRTGAFTDVFVIQPTDGQPAANMAISGKLYDSPSYGYLTYILTTGIIDVLISQDGITINVKRTTNAVFTDGTQAKPTLVAVTHDGVTGEVEIYVNGINVASTWVAGSAQAVLYDTPAPLVISDNSGTAAKYAGTLKAWISFTRTLNSGEIMNIYNRSKKLGIL